MVSRSRNERGIILLVSLLLVIILIAVFLLFYRDSFNNNPILGEAKLKYNIGGCNSDVQTKAMDLKSEKEPVISVLDNSIKLVHKLSYVCCAKLSLEHQIIGNVIEITEVNTGDICKCICEYDIDGEIGPLKAGEYQLKLFGVKYQNTDPSLILEKNISIAQ